MSAQGTVPRQRRRTTPWGSEPKRHPPLPGFAIKRPNGAIGLAYFAPVGRADISPEQLEKRRAAYAKDVATLPPLRVAAIIESDGFEPPISFFQAGLIHAWFSKRKTS